MASIIKKQILKHLSKFAKNLSADSIQLSTLKGEGELSNLELDCVAIQNLLDLPTWLQINHAKCNKVHVKIPWTKLKVNSITICLDCVDMDMVTCEKPRSPNGPSPIEASASSGDVSYGFIEKVLEGITVRINSINVNFKSEVFTAEFQLSQLHVYSTDPEWKKTDLRSSRIINNALGQILTFKKITWQTMRIVSDAASVRTGGMTTPIRLITNQTTVEIVLRRKLSNLSVLASRLHVKFDDLLWVLTDAQVQSALLCAKSIKETIERSKQQGRSEKENSIGKQNPSPPLTPNQAETPSDVSSDPFFIRYFIHETSYHCDVDRIDFHICDDGSNPSKAPFKKEVEGGAILITLHHLKVDHYPSHFAGKSREHFRDYNEIAKARDTWAEEIIEQFRKEFVELKKSVATPATKKSSKLQESCLLVRLGDLDVSKVSSAHDKERSNQKVFSSNRKELHLPDDMPLASVVITEYYYPDGRDYLAPHNNIFVRVNAPNLRAHWPSLLWINQLSLVTIKAVQKMLEDLGVVLNHKDPNEEEHTDIRIEALMPKIFIPLLPSNPDPNFPDGIEIHISQIAVTNCRHGEHTSRKSLSRFLANFKSSFLNTNSSFPSEKGHDYEFMKSTFEEHAIGGDSPLKLALQQLPSVLTRSTLIGKAHKDVWCVWLRQVWMDFVLKPNEQGKARTCPFVDSVPITIWTCEAASKPSPDTALKTRKTESLPSVHKAASLDVRQAVSQFTVSSHETSDLDVMSDDEKPDRPSRNRQLLDFYRQTIEKEVEASPAPAVKNINGAADTYVVVHGEKPISVILSHHQYVFLLRLMESIEKIGEKVNNDSNEILITEIDRETSSTGVRTFLPVVNLNLLMRPTTDAQPRQFSPSNHVPPPPPRSAPTPQVPPPPFSSAPSPAFVQGAPLGFRAPSPVSVRSSSPSEGCGSDAVSILDGDINPVAFFSTLTGDETNPLSRDHTSLSPFPPRRVTESDPIPQLRLKPGVKVNPRNETPTSGRPNSFQTLAAKDDDSLSCTSSGTSSLDQFVVLDVDSTGVAEEVGIHPKVKPHSSTPIPTDASFTPSKPVSSKPRRITEPPLPVTPLPVTPLPVIPSERKKEEKTAITPKGDPKISMINIATCGGIELAIDEHDGESAIRIVVPRLSLKQFGDMSLDDAVATFSRQATNAKSLSPHSTPSLRIRIDAGQSASRFCPGIQSHIQIDAHSVKESISTSTLANIGAFFEDEVAPEVIPMKIDVHDVKLSIEDDLNPVYPNSARSSPVHLDIHEAHVKRDNTGTFHISTESVVAPDLLTSLHFSANQKQAASSSSDVETPVKSAAAAQNSVDGPTPVRMRLEEVMRERDSLLLNLSQLQSELEQSEKERVHLQSLITAKK